MKFRSIFISFLLFLNTASSIHTMTTNWYSPLTTPLLGNLTTHTIPLAKQVFAAHIVPFLSQHWLTLGSIFAFCTYNYWQKNNHAFKLNRYSKIQSFIDENIKRIYNGITPEQLLGTDINKKIDVWFAEISSDIYSKSELSTINAQIKAGLTKKLKHRQIKMSREILSLENDMRKIIQEKWINGQSIDDDECSNFTASSYNILGEDLAQKIRGNIWKKEKEYYHSLDTIHNKINNTIKELKKSFEVLLPKIHSSIIIGQISHSVNSANVKEYLNLSKNQEFLDKSIKRIYSEALENLTENFSDMDIIEKDFKELIGDQFKLYDTVANYYQSSKPMGTVYNPQDPVV